MYFQEKGVYNMKREFVIMSDSGCDMSEEYLKENQIEFVPLGFIMDDITYGGEGGAQMGEKEFYEKVRAGAMPKTFQATPEGVKVHMEKYLKEGKDVLCVAFSSGLSGTANSFFIAAKEMKELYPDRKIFVTDSLCASMGEGLYLDYAIKKAEAGATIEETYEYLEGLKEHICHYFTVDDLFHLKRGGRVSAATAVVGMLLKIKPVLYVNPEGRLIAIGKAMGRKKSIRALFEKMQSLQTLTDGEPVFISHGDCLEEAESLAAMIRAEYPKNPVVLNTIGPVIGTHAGPGTIALFFRGKERAV